jgi:hypothetical protein
MELPDGFPVALVPAAAVLLPDPHPADVLPPAPRVSDALDAFRPDEAADAACFLLALAAVPRAEKLVAPVQAVREPTAEALLPRVLPVQL